LVLLEGATLLSGIGNGVATVVLPWLILERTGSTVATAVGAVGALWVTAAGFVVSMVLVACLRVEGAGWPVSLERPVGLWRGTRDGLTFVWRDLLLRTVALLSGVLVAIYLPIEGVILPVYFLELHAPARLGPLGTAMSGGGVVGALAYGGVGHRWPRRLVFVGALVGTTLAIAGMAVLPPYPLLLALGSLVGLFYGRSTRW
jgi:hypothetical protein